MAICVLLMIFERPWGCGSQDKNVFVYEILNCICVNLGDNRLSRCYLKYCLDIAPAIKIKAGCQYREVSSMLRSNVAHINILRFSSALKLTSIKLAAFTPVFPASVISHIKIIRQIYCKLLTCHCVKTENLSFLISSMFEANEHILRNINQAFFSLSSNPGHAVTCINSTNQASHAWLTCVLPPLIFLYNEGSGISPVGSCSFVKCCALLVESLLQDIQSKYQSYSQIFVTLSDHCFCSDGKVNFENLPFSILILESVTRHNFLTQITRILCSLFSLNEIFTSKNILHCYD